MFWKVFQVDINLKRGRYTMKYIILTGILALIWMFYMALFTAAAKEDRYFEEEFAKSIKEEGNDNLE